jgi:hypothetical protein
MHSGYKCEACTYTLASEVLAQNLLHDSLAHNHAGWVTDPTGTG